MMRTSLHTRYMAVLPLLIAWASHTQADEMKPTPGTNLAAGKVCTFKVPPNYGYCTDENDSTDLTDGKYWHGESWTPGDMTSFWVSKGTVGWQQSREPVGVRIDLGKVGSIGTVTLDSAAGSAQVTFPAAALLYVSDDGQSWHYVTDIINEAVQQDSYSRHRFVAANLNTRGRYVNLFLVQGGFYLFTDEIEVLAGTHNPQAAQFPVDSVGEAQLAEEAKSRALLAKQKNTTLYFIKAAREAIEKFGRTGKQQALTELKTIAEKAVLRQTKEPIDYQNGPPFTQLDMEVCRAVGRCFARNSRVGLQLWSPQPTLWSRLGPFDRPGKAATASLHVAMMENEYEAAAFNLSNNTSEPIRIRLRLNRPQGKAKPLPTAALTFREVVLVEASGFRLFADALPEAKDGTVTVPPGMTRQIWLTVHSAEMKPGSYSAGVVVEPDEGKATVRPLTVKVYPAHMPTNPQYLTTSFAYFTWKPAVGREKATAADLTTHYANAHVLHHYYIPWPKLDSNKQPLRPLQIDTTHLDEMLGYLPDTSLWILWPGFEFGFFQLGSSLQIGTPEHGAMFKEWVKLVRDHLQSKGIGTDRWCFMWVDEPGDDRWKEFVVPASRLAKEVDPSILVWEDQQVSMDLLKETSDLCDIYCPPTEVLRNNPALHQFILSRKQPGWHYMCASSKEMDPHSFYRLHHWQSVDLGLGGAGMWVYTDDLGTWNDYDGGTSYSMIYEGEDGPITSKRWEAWRDGIEDYEMMRQLREATKKSGDPKLTALLKDSPKLALENPDKPELILKRRREILEALAGFAAKSE